MTSQQTVWTIAELHQALDTFENELRASGKSENTVHTYVDRARRFLHFLSGDYAPAA